MDIKDWIKAARSHKGWTQQQLGEAVGRTKANVGHWETGKHEPKLDLIEAISRETGFPPPPWGCGIERGAGSRTKKIKDGAGDRE
jgi:transcriptional regulator with XRE-family HTH domain